MRRGGMAINSTNGFPAARAADNARATVVAPIPGVSKRAIAATTSASISVLFSVRPCYHIGALGRMEWHGFVIAA